MKVFAYKIKEDFLKKDMPLPAGKVQRQECLNATRGLGHRCNLPVGQFGRTYVSKA